MPAFTASYLNRSSYQISIFSVRELRQHATRLSGWSMFENVTEGLPLNPPPSPDAEKIPNSANGVNLFQPTFSVLLKTVKYWVIYFVLSRMLNYWCFRISGSDLAKCEYFPAIQEAIWHKDNLTISSDPSVSRGSRYKFSSSILPKSHSFLCFFLLNDLIFC